MSKMMRYILLNQEKGKDLLAQQQNEVNHYDMTPEQIQTELTNDKGYQDFLDKEESKQWQE